MISHMPAEVLDKDVDAKQVTEPKMRGLEKLCLRLKQLNPIAHEIQTATVQHLSEQTVVAQVPNQRAIFFVNPLQNTEIRAFHSSKRNVGYGPCCIVPGDIIRVLTGRNCPVILRPVDAHIY
jgi:hypothetical protein